MTKIEKAYLAGFIDGEGSIGIYPDYRHPSNYRLVLTICNTNKDVIEWVRKVTKELNCFQELKTTKNYPSWQKPKWKDVYSVWFGSGAAKRILKEIFPYLIVKKEHAQIAAKFPINPVGKHVTEKQRILKIWCYEQIKPLNKTGRNKRGPKKRKE